jgi:hypothetical protein
MESSGFSADRSVVRDKRPLSLSSFQRLLNPCARFRFIKYPGSSALPTIFCPLIAQSRLVRTLFNLTTRVSPGIAPSMKNGPVTGLPPIDLRAEFSSMPKASTLFVFTVSPGKIRRTGGMACVNAR